MLLASTSTVNLPCVHVDQYQEESDLFVTSFPGVVASAEASDYCAVLSRGSTASAGTSRRKNGRVHSHSSYNYL